MQSAVSKEALSMIRSRIHAFRAVLVTAALSIATSGVLTAQATGGGWRRADDPPETPAAGPRDPEPIDRGDAQIQADRQEPLPPARPANEPPPYGIPSELTVAPGTYLTVRVNDQLSSDRNQAGDPFSATLMQPLVVDGVVVAQRGQMVYGRVAEAQKARPNIPSRLGLELTELTLADGSQVPLRCQLVGREGGTAPGSEQAGTIISTSAIGAVVGAAAGWGRGAVIGAGVGATAGAIAVMLTRNRPTLIYPETALTFRIDAPLAVSTTRAPQAFRYVDPSEYDRPVQLAARPRPPAQRCWTCGGPPPYWGPMMYPYPYWGPYYGTGVAVVIRGGRYRRWR
jgi:hypothetical protein